MSKKTIWKHLVGYTLTLLLATLSTQSVAQLSLFGGKKAKEPPDWFLNPPANTASDFYGVAAANQLEKAKVDALLDVAANLGIRVGDTTTVNSEFSDGAGSMSSSSETTAVVGDTQFSHFSYLKTEHDPKTNTYWTLVKVDKVRMLADTKYRIDSLTTKIDSEFTSFEQSSNLAQVMATDSLLQLLDELDRLSNTRRYLDTEFNPEPVLMDIMAKKGRLRTAKGDLKVVVRYDQNTKRLAQGIEQMLSANKVKVVSNANASGATIISVTSDVKTDSFGKDHMALMNVKLESIDDKGNVLLSSSFEQNGGSRTSADAAIQQANEKLAERFNEEGLLTSLGFQ